MARINLTPERIRSFSCPAEKGQVFLWDSQKKGLGVRATPKTKNFIFQSRINGDTFRMTLGPTSGLTLEDARKTASGYVYYVANGKDPRTVLAAEAEKQRASKVEATREQYTLADIWPRYIEANKKRWSDRYLEDHYHYAQAGGEKYKRGKGKTIPGPLWSLMSKKLSDLGPETVKTWASDQSSKRPTACRNSFALLRACLNWAAEQQNYKGLIDLGAVSSRVKRGIIPPQKPKTDCLQREQLKGWFEGVRQIRNPIISAYLQTLLLTGSRREELARLTWADIDFKWNSMTIKDKVSDQRTIPLTPYVAELLAKLPRVNKWVFASPAAKSGRLVEPRIMHNRALAKAGIEGLTLHGLRRSFGTLSEWVEVPAGVVAQIMGHKPSATAEKHYRQRPIDLLRMWHIKVEAWILEQSGIEQPAKETIGLKIIGK